MPKDDLFLMLRFRDLTVGDGETIAEHRSVLNRNGCVWWGWWKRQTEEVPKEAMVTMQEQLERAEPNAIRCYLMDAGRERLYRAEFDAIRLAPEGTSIQSPDVFLSPDYYHRGNYPAWFRLTRIEDADFAAEKLRYHSFPTNSGNEVATDRLLIPSIAEARKRDVTLYLVTQ